MVQNTDIPLPHSAALSFTPYPTRCRPVSHQDLLFHLSQNTASPDQWNRVILWDRCPSCERTISVKALNRTQSGLASRSSLHAGSALTVPEYSLQQMYPVFYNFRWSWTPEWANVWKDAIHVTYSSVQDYQMRHFWGIWSVRIYRHASLVLVPLPLLVQQSVTHRLTICAIPLLRSTSFDMIC